MTIDNINNETNNNNNNIQLNDSIGRLNSKSVSSINTNDNCMNGTRKAIFAVAGLVALVGILTLAAAAITFAILAPPLALSAVTIGLISMGAAGTAALITSTGLAILGIVLSVIYVRKKHKKELIQPMSKELIQPMSSDSDKVNNMKTNSVKTGYPNAEFNCWLNTTLQLINAVPNDYAQNVNQLKQKKNETKADFDRRKDAAKLLLDILEKSRNCEVITDDEILKLKSVMSQVNVPRRNQFGAMGYPILDDIAYILDLKHAEFAPKSGDDRAWGYLSNTHRFNAVAYISPINPIAIPIEKGIIEYQDNIPILPLEFQGNKQNAPEMFILNTDGCPLDLDSTGNWPCIVNCQDGTQCVYELAACAINGEQNGVPHYYALVKENINGKNVWVEYDDLSVKVLTNEEACERIISNYAEDLIYRKIS